MITVIIRRSDEPKVIQMTQQDLARQLGDINGAEVLLEDTWTEGLRKVRTPYVCLIEPDCVFSASYFSSNFNLMLKAQSQATGGKGSGRGAGGGGYTKLAMISSCLGIRDFGNRIYNYELKQIESVPVHTEAGDISTVTWQILAKREKLNMKLYQVQVGFVPGAIIRMSSIQDLLDDELWDDRDLVKLSTAVSFYLWDTGRRVQLNPNTTYVTSDRTLEAPAKFNPNVPDGAAAVFGREGIGELGL